MTKSAQGVINHVKGVVVSAASKAMARPNIHEVQSFLEEYEALNIEIKGIQSELSRTKSALQNEQVRIRRNGSSDRTFAEWARRKAEIEAERHTLVERMNETQARMLQIKPLAHEQRRVMDEKSQADHKNKNAPLLQAILQELQLIRELLETKITK